MGIKFHRNVNISLQITNNRIIFLTIAAVYLICNFIWWAINTPIIPNNQAAMHFWDVFKTGWFYYNAPLVTWIMKFSFFIFGKENFDLQVIIVNYIFFLISLYFIYKIGKEIDSKETTGNIAMVLFALTPAVYGMTRQYGHQDYHIIAGITFNIYCLIRTNYFTDTKWSIIYGISAGLGLLIKDAFLAYFFVPWGYIAIQGLKKDTVKSKIINLFIVIFITSLIAGFHYFKKNIIKKILYEPITETVAIFDFENMSKMTIGLWEELLSPPIFLIFIVGLIWFLIKYRNRYKNILLLWFFIPWAIIMFMPHQKFAEYGLGFIPAMAIISAIYISSIKKNLVKNLILGLICIMGLFQFLIFSYIPNSILTEARIQLENKKFHYYKKTFIFYDSNDAKNNMSLVSKLEDGYGESIALFCNDRYDMFTTQFFVYKNKKDIQVLDVREFINIKNYPDYIVFAGKEVTMDDMLSSCIKNYDRFPSFKKIERKQFLSIVKDMAKEFDKIMQNNFELVEIWYPNNVVDENLKVKIFKKKDSI